MKLRQARKILRAFDRESRRAHFSGEKPQYRHNWGQWAAASFTVGRMRSLHIPFMAHFQDGSPDRICTIGGMGNENLARIIHDRGLREDINP